MRLMTPLGEGSHQHPGHPRPELGQSPQEAQLREEVRDFLGGAFVDLQLVAWVLGRARNEPGGFC